MYGLPPSGQGAHQGELGGAGEHEEAERAGLQQAQSGPGRGDSEREAGEADGYADAECVTYDGRVRFGLGGDRGAAGRAG